MKFLFLAGIVLGLSFISRYQIGIMILFFLIWASVYKKFSFKELILILDKIAHINSNFIFKIWKGSEEKKIINTLKNKFKNTTYYKPKSSRSESSEIYIVACGFIG